MPKYKISKSNLKEFFGFFGKKKRPKKVDDIIKNDPQLKAIDKKIKDLDKQARVQSSEYDELLRKMGI